MKSSRLFLDGKDYVISPHARIKDKHIRFPHGNFNNI